MGDVKKIFFELNISKSIFEEEAEDEAVEAAEDFSIIYSDK